MSRIKVLVVDDSLTVRKRLCSVLDGSDFQVVAEACDGVEAINQCMKTGPDVITMDIALPRMSGLAATEYIMAHRPTPILIVSASFNRGELFNTYDALAAGALDVLEKPRGTEADGQWEESFLSALRIVSRIRVITHPRAKFMERAKREAEHNASREKTEAVRPAMPQGIHFGAKRLVAIGASTGGPAALAHLLKSLPTSFETPVAVVMHIAESFATALGEWLDLQSPRHVRFMKEGEPIDELRGTMCLAPAGRHMVVDGGRLRLIDAPPRHSCCPSIDELFESVARDCRDQAVGVLLTGMGKDGAAGLLAMRRAGAATIAQDELTSVVYGMPKEAALLGAAEQVLPLQTIASSLEALCPGARRR